MISRYFIDRPIFASVLSILIVLAGLVSLFFLPIEQYPNITPPQIQVTATFNGADANTMAETVAAPIEQQVNGVEDMIYMYSENSSSGMTVLSVYFNIGSDPDKALFNVQNRVNLALPQIPQEVQASGVSVQKQSPSILMIISMQALEGEYDDVFMSNYANINVVDEILRLPGVANADVISARNYSMRVWLRPDLMAQLKITATDVINAIQEQNKDFAVGQIGMPPTAGPVKMTIPIGTKGRLTTPEDFENIILKATPDGALVSIKDIGHVDLGAQNYQVNGSLDGKPATLIAIYQQYGANALDVAKQVNQTMEHLSKTFPPGITYTIPYDTTLYVKVSIAEVVRTIFEAAILVVLIVFIFLQNARATLIPVLAMIVSMIGMLAGMHMLGFSLNTLTLFGMVLAIGIVVDDAIVVIENIERKIRDNGLNPKEAARQAMDEVQGPVIAIVFVLCAVFIPVALLGGIAGQLYKQFAITIAVSVVFSGFVALTLSPAVAALVLKPRGEPNWASKMFNKYFGKLTDGYIKKASWLVVRPIVGLGLFTCILMILGYLFTTVPTSFVPDEDQGYLMVFANLPDGASLDRTTDATQKVIDIVQKQPGFEHIVALPGFSLLENLNRTTVSTNFVILQDWSKRTAPDLHADSIMKQLYRKFLSITDAQVLPFNPPAIQGLGTVGGFEFWIENRGQGNEAVLESVTNQFIEKSKTRPELAGLSTAIKTDCMQLFLDVDRGKARAFGVAIGDIYQTLQSLVGSYYVNNFNKYGRVFNVMIQADPAFRETFDDLGQVYVKSREGQMVPLKSLMKFSYSKGPTLMSRFNGFPGAKITGGAAPGYTSGQAMKAMEEIAAEIIPMDMTYSWSGESYQEQATGGSSSLMLLGGILVIFLILAALYERWGLPFAIVLATPFGAFGAFVTIWLRGMPNDVYFQIGLVTLIALSAKNAILIVEFAMMKREEGMGLIEAAIEAAKLRFRAILMTSLTFIFGVIPLVISTGAGAASRHSVGTGVMGGMIAATFFAVFFVPLFYRLLGKYGEPQKDKEQR